MVKNSPSKAGDMGLIPGHIPHATGQLSLHTTTREGRAPQKKKNGVEVTRGQIINIFPCHAKKFRFIKEVYFSFSFSKCMSSFDK